MTPCRHCGEPVAVHRLEHWNDDLGVWRCAEASRLVVAEAYEAEIQHLRNELASQAQSIESAAVAAAERAVVEASENWVDAAIALGRYPSHPASARGFVRLQHAKVEAGNAVNAAVDALRAARAGKDG